MHADISAWKHKHNFSGDTSSAEKRTRRVVVLTAGMMLVEIVAGYFSHSMALVADGWHMGTHVAAFVLAALAYAYGRRHAKDARFTFGTGKVGVLGTLTSAIVLSIIALAIAGESIQRLVTPQGWIWLDPAVGLVGTVVILSWAYTLLRDTGSILLDRVPASSDLPDVIREGIENDGDSKIADLHIWQVSINKFAAIVSVVAHDPKTPDEYRRVLEIHEELLHVTIEVQTCCPQKPLSS